MVPRVSRCNVPVALTPPCGVSAVTAPCPRRPTGIVGYAGAAWVAGGGGGAGVNAHRGVRKWLAFDATSRTAAGVSARLLDWRLGSAEQARRAPSAHRPD